MIVLIDGIVIVLLVGVGLCAAPPGTHGWALPPIAWLALTTPLLVRSDVAVRRLPNGATVPGLVIVVATAGVGMLTNGAALGTGFADPALALVATAATAVGGYALSRTGALGLGDVKLAAGIVGSLMLLSPFEPGDPVAMTVIAVFAIVTSSSGVAGLVLSRMWPHRCTRSLTIARDTMPREPTPPGIAYGPCLLLGYWVALAFVGLARCRA